MNKSNTLAAMPLMVSLVLLNAEWAWPQTNALASSGLITNLKQTRDALTLYWDTFPEGIRSPLEQMLVLPLSGVPRVIAPDQQSLIDKYRSTLLQEINAWFVLDEGATKNLQQGLSPLAEKVAGCDSLGCKLSLGDLDGYLRATRTHIYLDFAVSDPFWKQSATPVTEFTATEVSQLSAIDKKRFEFSQIDAEALDSGSGSYSDHTFMGIASSKGLTRVPLENQAAQRALQTVRRIVRDPMATKLHWNIYDLKSGLYGETVVAFAPPAGPEYAQNVGDGYIARFFISNPGDLFTFCFSRNPDIYRTGSTPKQSLQESPTPDWLSSK